MSRRDALLESRLGVRPIHRSARRFSVTELGQEFSRHCVAAVVEAQSAQEVIERQHGERRGTIRMSCSTTLLH